MTLTRHARCHEPNESTLNIMYICVDMNVSGNVNVNVNVTCSSTRHRINTSCSIS